MKKKGLKTAEFLNNDKMAALLALLVFIPLLFLNIRHDHDWGGDFAQYLSQADNIAHFRAMGETGYEYNEAYPSLAPKAYPPGFPLLIAPLVRLYGNDIPPFNYLISVLLIITAMFSVLMLKQKYGLLSAIALSLVIYYNPYPVSFKSEIMADIPFSLLFIGFLMLTGTTDPKNFRKWILAGIVAGLAAATKTAGFSLFLALLVYALHLSIPEILKRNKPGNILKSAPGPLVSLAAGITLYLLLSLIFMRGTEGSGSYLNTFNFIDFWLTITTNIYSYSEALRGFFIGLNTPGQWFGLLVGSAVLTFFITGLIIALAKKPGLWEWISLIYIGLLFVYPYHFAGFRFLLPMAPLIMYYAAKAVISLNPGKGGAVLAMIVAIMMLMEYYPKLVSIQQSTRAIQDGPYALHVQDAFKKVKSLTAEDALIVFNKPTVLAHYTGRRSMSHNPGSTVEEMLSQFAGMKPSYFLVYKSLPDPKLELYIESKREETDLLWQDKYFKLYKKR